MPQATVHRITSARMSKLSKLDTLDAINSRLRFSRAALQFAEARGALESEEGYTPSLDEGEFGESEVRAILLRMVNEVDDLVEHLLDITVIRETA